jgi:hypothetical protein
MISPREPSSSSEHNTVCTAQKHKKSLWDEHGVMISPREPSSSSEHNTVCTAQKHKKSLWDEHGVMISLTMRASVTAVARCDALTHHASQCDSSGARLPLLSVLLPSSSVAASCSHRSRGMASILSNDREVACKNVYQCTLSAERKVVLVASNESVQVS